MTFEEAKKILEKEGFKLDGPGKPHAVSGHFTEFEPLYIYEAMQVVTSAGYNIMMPVEAFDARKARLKKEHEEHANAPASGKEKEKKGNPALEEAASQFNDALLDEQGKKIKHLTKKIARLNKIIHKKNEDLRLTKIREKNLAELGLKYVGENEKLKKKLADKIVNEIDARALKSAESALAYKDEVIETLDKELAEVKHELSSLKRPFRPDSTEAVVLFTDAYAKAVRKHLPCTEWKNDEKEVSVTYILENGKKSKIALDFTGDEIIFSRTDPDKPRKDSLYSYKDKQLAEKDEVIADLGNELAATKKELEEKTKLVEVVRKGSKEYCDYGIAAEKMIQKMADVIVYDRPVFSKDFEQYRLWANGYRFNPQLPEIGEEEEKKFSPVKDTHPTEDNPEEVRMNEILEHVRKVLEEGGTVSTSYDKAEEGGDQSATIVQHRKSIVDLFKEIKRLWQE